jgi:N-acyl-D-amino-acid deacylase
VSGEILIRGGVVMDGRGAPAVRADVLVRGSRIEDVGRFPEARTGRVIDATGLAVAPGFIDVHTHLDFLLPSPRHAEALESWARQGVTTIVAGNCGFSPAPVAPAVQSEVSTYWSFALPRDGLDYEWSNMAEFFRHLEGVGQAFNVAILTGQNVLRASAMGAFSSRRPREDELAEMKRMLRESLAAGSIGLSLGLFYAPGIYADSDEVSELASVLTEFGAPLVPHTRGLSVTYDKAVEEVIAIAERHGVPLHLSHHAGGTLGEKGTRAGALRAVARALDRGLAIGHDNIPWACGPTTVLALLPPRLFAKGVARGLEALRDVDVRERVIDELENAVPTWPTWENGWWTDKFLGFSSRYAGFRKRENRHLAGRTLSEIAEELGREPYQALFDLLIEEEGRMFMTGGLFDQPLGDDFVVHLLEDPRCSVMTDIVGADFDHGNPVAYGAFPKVIGNLARDRGAMSQEEAVRRMTSQPAAQMQLADRGEIRKGAFADITIFDPDGIANRASYAQPRRAAEGIECVLINGVPVLEGGEYRADARAGQVLRRS